MKKTLYSLLLALATTNCLFANYNQIEYSDLQISPAEREGASGPWTVDVNYDHIGRSKFTKRGFKDQKIEFNSFDTDASMVFYYNADYKEAANFEIGYNRTFIDWKQNPYFSQRRFDTVYFSFGAITQRYCNWLWKAKVTMNIDARHWDINNYATYDGLAWGRYNYSEDIGVHMGILVLTGMKIDRVYPILGADWRINECWKLNAVFPVNMSLVYSYTQEWWFDLAIRAFQVRYRTGEHQPLPKAVTLYQNVGIEFGANYEIANQVHVNVHAGSTFGGRLKIANKQNRRPRHFKFEPAPYAGASVEWHF